MLGAQTDTAWFQFGDNLRTHGTAVMLVRTLSPPSTSVSVSSAFQDETKQTVRPTSVEHLFPVKSDLRHQLQHDSLARGTELRGTSPAASSFLKKKTKRQASICVVDFWVFTS